ncbi:MAG TPA: NAD(P)-dependent oxidoreductase [Patescibacteria group bacterium]|nr:NAD(P)-dependent oxidoreductase [Patescibacteria group bacterium]
MKKVLGTGLSGLVGSRIVELLGKKFDFQNLDLTTNIDITDKDQLEKIIGSSQADSLIHLAAFTDVNQAWEQRGDKKGPCYQINVVGTRNLAQLCQQYNKYLIHFSTDFIFDGKKKTAYKETDKPQPIEWYGQTKYWAEEEIKKLTNNFCILRIAFPYRAKFEPKIDLIRRMIKGFEEKSLYPMFADQITTPTFIDDIAFGLEKILESKPKGVFHLVSSSFQSPYDLALEIADVFGFDKKLVKKGSLAEYQKKQSKSDRPWHKFLGLSNEKIEKELGIKMKTLREGLEKMKIQLSN